MAKMRPLVGTIPPSWFDRPELLADQPRVEQAFGLLRAEPYRRHRRLERWSWSAPEK